MGLSTAFHRPVQWSEVRASSRSVVKPIWLLTMTWMVPATVKPGTPDSCSASVTLPWPITLASVCSSTQSTRLASPPCSRSRS